jgi:hypothetical protein
MSDWKPVILVAMDGTVACSEKCKDQLTGVKDRGGFISFDPRSQEIAE